MTTDRFPCVVRFDAKAGVILVRNTQTDNVRSLDVCQQGTLNEQERLLLAHLTRIALQSKGEETSLSRDTLRRIVALCDVQKEQQAWGEGRYVTLNYDIPQEHNWKFCTRPFRREGFPLTLSQVCLKADNVNEDHIAVLRAMDPPCTVDIIRADLHEADRLRAMAREKLAVQIREEMESLTRKMESLESRYQQVFEVGPVTPREIDKAGRQRNNDMRKAIADGKVNLADRCNACSNFGHRQTLADALTAFADEITRCESLLAEGEAQFPPLRAVGTARKRKSKKTKV